MGGRGKQQPPGPTLPAAGPPLAHRLRVPGWLRALRWSCFCATVALAVGVLAILNQHLTSIPWTYDGKLEQYVGRPIRIQFCQLSDGTGASADARCGYAFAVASVSLALSLIWSYLQALRRNPFKHPSVRLADLTLCVVWLVFWGVSAVLLCIWADAANRAGSFLQQGRNWRNGLCVLAWLEFLFVAALAGTGVLLCAGCSQALFDKWEEQGKAKRALKEEQRMRGLQEKEAAAAAAAAMASRQAAAAGAGGAGAGAAGGGGAAAAAPAAAPAAAAAGAGAGGPPGAGAGALAAGADSARPSTQLPTSTVAGDTNPFRTTPGPSNV